MYKKIIIVFALFILAVGFAIHEWDIFGEISEKNDRQEQFQNRATGISLDGVCVYKSSEKLFADKYKTTCNSLKSQIKSIAKPCKTSDVKVHDINRFELILISENEKTVTRCLQDLYLQLNGLVKFQDVKLVKENDGIKAKIICEISYFNSENLSKNIKINPQKIVSAVSLFKTKKTHQLLAIINDSQAFIDDDWRKVGDEIDEDTTIIDIQQCVIQLKSEGQVKTVHVGEKW